MSKINFEFFRCSAYLLCAVCELIEETTSMLVYDTSIEVENMRYNLIFRVAYNEERYVIRLVDADIEDDYVYEVYKTTNFLFLEKDKIFTEDNMYDLVDRLRHIEVK